MSMIKLKFEIVFSSDNAWRSINDFESDFAKFLSNQNMLAERIQSREKGDEDFCLYIFKNEMMNDIVQSEPKAAPTMSPGKQAKRLETKKYG